MKGMFGCIWSGICVGWLAHLHHAPVIECLLWAATVFLIMTMLLTHEYHVRRID